MIYETIQPPPSLAHLVKCFWILESDQPYIHRSVADICPELVFHYKGRFDEIAANGTIKPSFTAGIHGPSQTFSRFTIDKAFGIFGVYLYPQALPVLFGLPATELTDQMPDLEQALGKEGKELQEKIITANDHKERVKIATAFFEKRLSNKQKNKPPVVDAIHYVIQNGGLVSVQQLSKAYFLSARQFERQFKAATGFSPKLFSRIVRFHALINAVEKKPVSLTALAYEYGYYDQSHFIHECKTFSGHQPGHYFSGMAEGTEWKW